MGDGPRGWLVVGWASSSSLERMELSVFLLLFVVRHLNLDSNFLPLLLSTSSEWRRRQTQKSEGGKFNTRQDKTETVICWNFINYRALSAGGGSDCGDDDWNLKFSPVSGREGSSLNDGMPLMKTQPKYPILLYLIGKTSLRLSERRGSQPNRNLVCFVAKPKTIRINSSVLWNYIESNSLFWALLGCGR